MQFGHIQPSFCYRYKMCIRDRANAVPIQLPIGSEDTFKGIIDLVEMDADIYYDDMGNDMRVEPIPEDMMELAQEYRTKLLDSVADLDDDIMMMVLEGEDVPTDMIRAALRKGTIEKMCIRDRSEAAGQSGGRCRLQDR